MYPRFMLREDCFLVKGAKRGAIYDLKSGNVYSIDDEACRIIELCEQGVAWESIFGSYPELDREEVFRYLKLLEENKLGRFLESDEEIKKIEIKEPDNNLDFIWLEVTENCNLRCIHCYQDSVAPRYNGDDRKMSSGDWKRVVDEAYGIGCRRLQFIGGEPLLAGNLLELIDYVCQKGYNFLRPKG